MKIRDEINKLNELEKQLYARAAVNTGLAIVGYASDIKLLVLSAGACVLYDCYNGIFLNKERDELSRRYEVERRFGEGQ